MKNTKYLIILLICGIGTLTLCSCGGDEEKDPTPVVSEPQCYLKSEESQVQSNESLTRYSYDGNNKLTSINSDGFFISFDYTDSRVASVKYGDWFDVEVIYSDQSDIPTRLEYLYSDGEKLHQTIEKTGDNITKIEFLFVESEVSTKTRQTFFEYNSDGTLNNILTEDYDEEKEIFFTKSQVQFIVSDDNINPYMSSNALIIATLLNEEDLKLGKGNILKYETSIETSDPWKISNTYTYNEDGYPLTQNRKGFSSETNYTFTYDCK